MPQFKPLNYKIRLEPDLINFKFTGSVEIRGEAPQPVEEIALNMLEIAIWNCQVRQNDAWVSCPFLVDPPHEEVRIKLPHAMAGDITIGIDYQGHINDKMAGFYRSQYVNQGATRYMAVTQFEESDARRAFPCCDHPARKATFDIEMDVDPELTAISNGAVQAEEPLPNGKKRVKFEQTPKMSTYLVFFGVGEFVSVTDPRDARVRVVTLPDMQPHAQRGLEFGRQTLEFSEAYYGIAYPLPKLDLIAVPDFAFGAMENWGAVTFRENLLLYYPDRTSKAGEERICEVIAHEIAHQWFGNLVTPSDWQYLWLNESFATYFGFGVVDHYYPQWHTWDQFLQGHTATALARDALHATFPIEIPGGEHVIINASTAPLVYSKGGSILRQIEGYLGPAHFKKGLRHYLKTHEYGCAASHHLCEALEEVSEQPVTALMKSWIEQPGFPLVEVRREGATLILTQKRFTCLANDSEQIWLVPLKIRLFADSGESRLITFLLDSRRQTVEIAADTVAYKVNDGQTGFFHVKYSDFEDLAAIGRKVRSQKLPSADRWGLANDLFALVRSGDASWADYLKFLAYYENEDAFLPLTGIAQNLYRGYLILDGQGREAIVALAQPWLERILARIGYEPRSDESHTTSILRDQLIWQAAVYGSQPVVAFAQGQFEALCRGQSINPDIMRSVLQVGALGGGSETFGWLEQRLESSAIEHERLNILTALGCFRDPAQIAASQHYVLQAVPARNKFIPVVAMASNPYAIPLLWDWYVSHLQEIEQFHPTLYERVVAAIIPVAGLAQGDPLSAFFEDYLQKKDKARDVIQLSLEKLEINRRMRERGSLSFGDRR
ncbi:MAG: M1 family metallopeptidase [Desulfobacterales bacterium]|nr:MAG: M1 family metallopeptidase [Desulfobacterales bacterium]